MGIDIEGTGQTYTQNPPAGTTWQNPGGTQKPWYQNEAFAGAVAGGISGISNYLMEQERQKGAKSLQNDRFANEERTMNAAVQRASTMPLLQRFTKPKKKV